MGDLRIFSYLIQPGKGKDEDDLEPVRGTEIAKTGRLYSMLAEVFVKSDRECNIPVRFVMAADGSQNNEVRDQLVDLIRGPTLAKGRQVAVRLRDVTTAKSGLGLLFVILGGEETTRRLVVSRFPANQGVLAEATGGSLDVQFVERIFMRSANAYKAALYQGASFDEDFWDGVAVDKQINVGGDQLANYWIREFLRSDFKTTSKAGTKRLAVCLREAIRVSKSLEVKQEILSAVTLGHNLDGQVVSIDELMGRFGLSSDARAAIEAQVRDSLRSDTFLFSAEEFHRHAKFSSTELDNGAILSAPSERFEECFDRELLNQEEELYRFSTKGRIVDRKVRGRLS